MSNDMTRYELYDRLCNQKCPVCEIINFRISQHMECILYESVNDKDLRTKVREGNGFCNFHSFMLLRKGDPLAHAIIYSDLIENALSELDAKVAKKKKADNNNRQCIFCIEAQDIEQRYIKVFIEAFADASFEEKYKSDALLCIPHLRLVISSKDNCNIKTIKHITLQKYKELLNDLSEIKRKHDYRFLEEIWTQSEKEAWGRAVEVFSAREGIR